MFASLKLTSLKCQSSGDVGKSEESEGEDHTYERLPQPSRCECGTAGGAAAAPRSPTAHRNQLTRRISKWRMECPMMSARRVSRSENTNGLKSSSNNSNEALVSQVRGGVRTKVTTVNIEREGGTLGITLRGGFHHNSELSKPVTITHVKPDGPAAKEGTIKPGDRLLAVDGLSLQGSSLAEAQALLKQQSVATLLTIEYDVNVLESVEHASGPLLVEIERPPEQELGLTLYQSQDCIVVERVKTGSLVDRCGALHVGDEILAVNNARVDETPLGLEDVEKLLDSHDPVLRLEILPSHTAESYSHIGTWRNQGPASMSGYNSLKCHPLRQPHQSQEACLEAAHLANGFYGPNVALTHSETLHTTISKENGTFGMKVVDSGDGSVLISSTTPGGPAERSQCLHPGDRVLSVNHRSVALNNLTAQAITDLLESQGCGAEQLSAKLSLHTQFDVLDSVVPTSGIFTVKLAKKGSGGLGITITASKASGFFVCEMKKGSIAHRAGSLMPGDKILAINDIPLEQCSVEYAAHVLHQTARVVTLKIQRTELNADYHNSRKVTYTVELQRYGGPLGITIAGSEEPFQPITVSGLTPGGLAEQTGVLHVGDVILAINGHLLYGEPLSKAHSLLQNSSDLVTLKVSRTIPQPVYRAPENRSPILPSSIDSAVESWGSSHLDLTPSPDQRPHDAKAAHDSELCLGRTAEMDAWSQPDLNFNTSCPGADRCQDQNPNLALFDEITNENLKIKQELEILSSELDEQCKARLEAQGEGDGESPAGGDPDTEKTVSTEVNSEQNTIVRNQKVVRHDDNYVNMQPLEVREDGAAGEVHRESCLSNDLDHFEMNAFLPDTADWYKTQYLTSESNEGSIRSEFHASQLYKVTLAKDPIYEDFGFSVSDGLYERGVFINRIRKGGPADVRDVLKPYDRILQVNDTYTQDFDCCLTVPLIASAGDSLQLLVARSAYPDNLSYEQQQTRKMISQDNLHVDVHHETTQRILV